MTREEEPSAVCTFLRCSLIGTRLLIGGAVWLDSVPDGGCPCSSVHCCALSGECPYYAPCLCQSVGLEPSNNTCAPRKGRDESDRAGAISMIVIGAAFSSTLAFILALLALLLVIGLLALIGMGFLELFGAIGRVIGSVCSKKSTETQTEVVQTQNGQLNAEEV